MKFNLFHKIFSAFMVTILATIVVLTLIVEDESKIAELLRDYLVAAGFMPRLKTSMLVCASQLNTQY
jgi:hypothetical protein